MSENIDYPEGFYIKHSKLVYLIKYPNGAYTEESILSPHYLKQVTLNNLINYEPLSEQQLKWLKNRINQLELLAETDETRK